MAWDERYRTDTADPMDNTGILLNGTDPYYGTSTSTIVVTDETKPSTAGSARGGGGGLSSGAVLSTSDVRLRMYGKFDTDYTTTVDPHDWYFPQSGAIQAGAFIGYLDSDDEGQFSATGTGTDNRGRPLPDAEPTWIPLRKVGVDWVHEKVTGYPSATNLGDDPSGYMRDYCIEESLRNFAVLYKDPSVVAIPEELGGGYLMFLARTRIEIIDGTVDPWLRWFEGRPDLSNRVLHLVGGLDDYMVIGSSIGDIVAFRCDNSTFTGSTLTGPYLVVHSLRAVEDQFFRLWLGVPGAVFVDDVDGSKALLVYYAAERTVSGNGAYPDDAGDAGYSYYDATNLWHYDPSWKWSYDNGFYGEGFTSGIVVSRFGEDELRRILASPITPESDWRMQDAWKAELRMKIRLWVPTGSSPALVPFKGAFTNPDLAEKDPCPVLCSDTLNLFFTQGGGVPADSMAPSTGQGIWRAVSKELGVVTTLDFDDTHDVQCNIAPALARYGVDFVVAELDTTTKESEDMIARSLPEEVAYIDPDVVYVSDLFYPWLVWCGGNALTQFHAAEAAGCTTWSDAV